MADPSSPLLLDALSRAAAAPEGLPLFGSRSAPGLFAATGPGRGAAQHARDEGLLHVLRTETKGKAAREIAALTEKGFALLLRDASPKHVLQDLVQTLRARQSETAVLVNAAEQMRAGLDALHARAEKVLEQVHELPAPIVPSMNGSDKWRDDALALLARRHQSTATDDCALPELFRHAKTSAPTLSIGRFHDGLRKLHDEEKIYLHPWTGPLYEMPEPTLALLVGHEIAYYASYREPKPATPARARFALAGAAS
jgi:hypothetical protein